MTPSSDMLLALTCETRLDIIKSLSEGPEYTKGISHALEIRPSVASHHLVALHKAGWLRQEKTGPHVSYALNRIAIAQMRDWLSGL